MCIYIYIYIQRERERERERETDFAVEDITENIPVIFVYIAAIFLIPNTMLSHP